MEEVGGMVPLPPTPPTPLFDNYYYYYYYYYYYRKDVVLSDVNMGDFEEVMGCKARAAWLLSELTRDMELHAFVLLSSIAPLIGGVGISAYAAANAYLDGLVRYRRSLGLPASTFNMGSLSDVGILADNVEARTIQQKVGFPFLHSRHAYEILTSGLQCNLDPIITMFTTPQSRSSPLHNQGAYTLLRLLSAISFQSLS